MWETPLNVRKTGDYRFTAYHQIRLNTDQCDKSIYEIVANACIKRTKTNFNSRIQAEESPRSGL